MLASPMLCFLLYQPTALPPPARRKLHHRPGSQRSPGRAWSALLFSPPLSPTSHHPSGWYCTYSHSSIQPHIHNTGYPPAYAAIHLHPIVLVLLLLLLFLLPLISRLLPIPSMPQSVRQSSQPTHLPTASQPIGRQADSKCAMLRYATRLRN
ncbi:hypothetical protein HDK77DRAFT_85100 [Phyllosticta capitalensis]|uniref:Uncharacterized protein n=1 Tax=Phyllosticta capitalensis TaxID=121624 RepID=A0ABR1YEG9_9PEZI